MGHLDFARALFTEFCGGGKNCIYSKIPLFSYSYAHLSLRITSQVFLLANRSCSDRVLDLAGNWNN